MLKLLDLLDLSEDTEMEFLVSFRAMRDKQQFLQQRRETVLRRLGEGLRADSLSPEKIHELVMMITGLRKEHLHESERFIAEMMKLLAPEQVGKLVIFQERFEHELLEQMRSYRERGGMRGGGRRGVPQTDHEKKENIEKPQ